MIPLPHTAEYALRAVLEIARRHPQPVRVAVLASSPAVGAPANYLAKTLGQLARAGVLISMRGPSGGFRLAEAPSRLTLARVVAVFQDQTPRRCLLGMGPCGTQPDCVVHARWKPLATQVEAFFRSTTVADLTTTDADALITSVTSFPLNSQSVP